MKSPENLSIANSQTLEHIEYISDNGQYKLNIKINIKVNYYYSYCYLFIHPFILLYDQV